MLTLPPHSDPKQVVHFLLAEYSQPRSMGPYGSQSIRHHLFGAAQLVSFPNRVHGLRDVLSHKRVCPAESSCCQYLRPAMSEEMVVQRYSLRRIE